MFPLSTSTRAVGILVAAATFLSSTSCDTDPLAPAEPTLVGTWSIGDNAGLWGLVSGSFVFEEDGGFTVVGTERTDSGGFQERSIQGSWSSDATGTTLSVDPDQTRWLTEFADADEVFFLELGGGRWFRLFKPPPD